MAQSERFDAERFDAAYYRRFYGDPRTRVADRASTDRLVTFVVAYVRFLGLPLRHVLDLGCGHGLWRAALRRRAPRARYHGVEVSAWLCRRFGWQRGSAVDYAPGHTFDLVVCQGVLQYLADGDAAAAIDNLGRLACGALYVEALTDRDWAENCDRALTDGDVNLRPLDWYRRRLARSFVALGGGLFVRRDAGIATFELETPG
jgi:SAM-dependent methyltransferase